MKNIKNYVVMFSALILFIGCSSRTEIIDSPHKIEGLYNSSAPVLVNIPGSTAQGSESKNYNSTYEEVHNATILSLSFNKYNILIDDYENGFISGRNSFCTYAIYLKEINDKPTVRLTIIYDIFSDFENKDELIRRDINNQFMTVYRFL